MRLKEFVLSGLLMAVFACVQSCSEDKPVIDNSWNGSGMNVKDEVVFDGNTSQTINIKASVKPVLTCDVSWLRIGQPANITVGIYSVELTAEPNTTGETRTAEISVTAGKETAVVKVMQLSGDMVEIRSISPEGNLNPAGGVLSIVYVSTGKVSTNLPEWMAESSTRTLEEGRLILSYGPNTTGKDREGIIVLATGTSVTNFTVLQPSSE